MAFLSARVTGIRETKAALRRVQRKTERLDLYNASKIVVDEARHTAHAPTHPAS